MEDRGTNHVTAGKGARRAACRRLPAGGRRAAAAIGRGEEGLGSAVPAKTRSLGSRPTSAPPSAAQKRWVELRFRIDVSIELPLERLQPLFAESAAAGLHHLTRLREEWQHGVNRFDHEGEALYFAREEERIIALGGLNLDPYSASPRIGRVRRLYVLAEYRRQGVGRTLMKRLIRDARESFAELRLRTANPGAATFFEALGFEAATSFSQATHRLLLP